MTRKTKMPLSYDDLLKKCQQVMGQKYNEAQVKAVYDALKPMSELAVTPETVYKARYKAFMASMFADPDSKKGFGRVSFPIASVLIRCLFWIGGIKRLKAENSLPIQFFHDYKMNDEAIKIAVAHGTLISLFECQPTIFLDF